jgi:ferredoxin
MKVTVHEERCVGSGNCVLTAPGIFDQSEDTGTVVLLTENPPPDQESGAREAASLCPGRAIAVSAQ